MKKNIMKAFVVGFIFFFLFSPFLQFIITPIILNLNSTNSNGLPYSDDENILDNNPIDNDTIIMDSLASGTSYQGLGAPLLALENASIKNSSQWLDLNSASSSYAYAILPANWNTTQIRAEVYNLTYYQQVLSNPTFSGSATGWTYGETGSDLDDIDGGYTGGYVYVDENEAGGWLQSTTFEVKKGYWQQIINPSPDMRNIIDADFQFDIYRETNTPSDVFCEIFVDIEGSRVWTGSTEAYGASWSTVTVSFIPLGIFDLSDGVNITLGIAGAGQDYFWASHQYRVRFDNIYLYLRGQVYPQSIGLTMNSSNVINNGWGSGTLTLNQEVGGDSSVPIDVTGFFDTTYSNVEMNTHFSLDAISLKNTTKTQVTTDYGASFNVKRGSDVDWTMYYYSYEPPGYENYTFKFSKPLDWTITSVLNPYRFPELLGSCSGGSNGDDYLSVPISIASTPGFWQILGTSYNYVDEIQFQKNDGGWVEDFNYRPGNQTRVWARISDGTGVPDDITSTRANVSVYYPNGTIWFYEQVTPDSSGIITTTSRNIPSEPVPGNYSVVVQWNNTNTTIINPYEVGGNQTWFTVQHSTDLYTTGSQAIQVLEGESIIMRVNYRDLDNLDLISDANITFVVNNWNGVGNDLIINTSHQYMVAGGGVYIVTLPTDVTKLGKYTVDVYADKNYYDSSSNMTCFDLLILEDTTIWYDDIPVIPYAEDAIVTVFGENMTGPLEGATVYSNVSINSYQDASGTYTINLSTSSMAQGQYKIQISLNKSNHINRTLNIPLTIRAISTDFHYTPPGNLGWSDTVNATIDLYYLDADHSLQGITGATVQMTGTPNSSTYPGLADGTLLNIYESATPGLYVVNINMSSLLEGKYYFNFSASSPNYNTRTLTNVIMNIVPTPTEIECQEWPAAIIPQGPYNISFEYWDLNVVEKIVNTTQNPVNISIHWDNSTIDSEYSLIEAPTKDKWYIEINTTNYDLNIKYNLTINVNKTHYESQEINITITLSKNIASMGITPPDRTVWGENVTILVAYTDLAGTRPPGTTLELNWNSSLWYSEDITLNGLPYYNITLNASNPTLGIPSSGYWILEINCSAPNYDKRSQDIYLYLRPIDTQIFYQSPPVQQYGSNATFYIQYYDSFHNQPIESDDVVLSVNISNSYYNWYRLGDRYYITINTTYWGYAGTFPISITTNWNGTNPRNQYENNTVSILFTVRNGSTEILYEPPGQIAWGHNITALRIQYHDTDTDTYPNITASDAVVYINGEVFPTSSITFESATNTYILNNIDTDDWNVGAHNLNITITKEHYDPAERIISITIRSHSTELVYTPPGQIPWGVNTTLNIRFHDVDEIGGAGEYPNMNMNDSNVLIIQISGENIAHGSVIRIGDEYQISDLNMSMRDLGSYTLNVTVFNNSNLYFTASASIPITIRNVSTYLSYDPPGLTPYSATENATFTITYEDEFGVGIDGASISLELIYEDGGAPTKTFIYNTNWTYSYISHGDYKIEITMQNLNTSVIYTFEINVSKANYIARTLSSVNLTLRDTYTRLRSPQAPSAIAPEGIYNISIYYEDREAGVGVAPPVTLEWVWDHTAMQGNSTLITVGSGTDTYWIIQINTTGFTDEYGENQIYNLTVNASKLYYEWQNLSISIQVSKNIPIFGFIPPENTVWGENVTFNASYTTIDGTFISGGTIWLNWTQGYWNVQEITTDKVYKITINTSGDVVPDPSIGYHIVRINASAPTMSDITQTFQLRVRSIDTQILYEAPEITPIGENETFSITLRDTFHSVNVYDTNNLSIQVNISSSYYNWVGNPTDQNYEIEIDTNYWSQAGTYPITIIVNWTGTNPANLYQNNSLTLNLNVRNRVAELNYDPIGSIAWGENTSIVIQYHDVDLDYYPSLSANNVTINQSSISYDSLTGPANNKYTITNVDIDNFTIGTHYINVTVQLKNYTTISRLIP
ncbi:MAG: hypothetical protein ACTSVE_07130, partial [Candidatus Helarchaeota archaeon]